MTAATPLTWVVGRGGLLGGAVEVALGRAAWTPPRAVPWADPVRSASVLREVTAEFGRAVDGGPWQVAWCAGAGVTGTPQSVLDDELEVLARTLDALAGVAVAGARPTLGSLFLASSAGGLYAGAAQDAVPPFDEHTVPHPLAPYGRAKVAAETLVRDWAGRTGVTAVVGRIANLYGPGQDLAKPQGLISQMCRAHLTGQPLSVYVPLDTVRDYVFAADAGPLVRDLMERSRREARPGDGTSHLKVICSGRGVTVGAVVSELRRLFKRAPRIVLGASASAAYQARDLRLRSVVWPDLDARPVTPLPVGMKVTVEHLLRQLQQGAVRRTA